MKKLTETQLDIIYDYVKNPRHKDDFIGQYNAGLTDGLLVKDLGRVELDFTEEQINELNRLEIIYCLRKVGDNV